MKFIDFSLLIIFFFYSGAVLAESAPFPRAYFYKYKHGNDVFYVIPPAEFQDEKNWEKYKEDSSGVSWREWDVIVIPAEKVKGIPFETIYVKGALKAENIKVDPNFESRLQPTWKIKADHEKRLNKKIGEEREKDSPDILKILTFKDELESMQEWSKKRCYEQELKNMEEDGENLSLKRERLMEAIEIEEERGQLLKPEK